MPEDLPIPPPPPPASPQTPPYPYGNPYASPSPYPAYGRPPRPRRSAWFWVAVIGGSFAVIVLLITAMVWSTIKSITGDDSATIDGLGGSKIGVIDIDGVILDADTVNTQIRKFGDDSSVKAIILHINSPGGGAAASQEIYNEVVRVRQEKHKKIVASVESVGASGAYYIASGCDKIYANQASVVGSIGVIMEWTNYGDLMKWAKLKNVVIHAGTLKDAGDPTRDMTPEEQAYFQSLVDNMYGQFVHDVATGRHTSDDAHPPARHRPGLDRPAGHPARPHRQDRRLPRRPHRHRPRRRHQRRTHHRPPRRARKASSPPSPTTPTPSSPTPANSSTRPPASTSCGDRDRLRRHKSGAPCQGASRLTWECRPHRSCAPSIASFAMGGT